MSVLYDATSNNKSTTQVASLTWSHTCTGTNRLLVVGVSTRLGASGITGITYNGVALTQIQEVVQGGDTCAAQWYLVNPASGANNVVVSFAANRQCVGGAISFTNVDQSSPLGNVTTNSNASGTTISGTVSISTGSQIATVATDTSSGASATPNTGTSRWAVDDSGTNSLEGYGSSSSNGDGGWANFSSGVSKALCVAEVKAIAYTVVLAQGSYALTGKNLAFSYGRKVVLTVGSYALTGFSLAFSYVQKWIKQALNTSVQVNLPKTNADTWANGSKNSSSLNNQTKN